MNDRMKEHPLSVQNWAESGRAREGFEFLARSSPPIERAHLLHGEAELGWLKRALGSQHDLGQLAGHQQLQRL